jgi:hypothetical protein
MKKRGNESMDPRAGMRHASTGSARSLRPKAQRTRPLIAKYAMNGAQSHLNPSLIECGHDRATCPLPQ